MTVPRLDSECLSSANDNDKTPLMCANDRDIIELFKDNLSEYEHTNPAINTQYANNYAASDVHKYYTQQPQQFHGLPGTQYVQQMHWKRNIFCDEPKCAKF